LEAQEYRVENHIVLELKGRVDEFNTAILRDEIHTIINTGRSRLAIDLSKTEFLSAHCMHAIWKCQRRAQKFGGDIVLFGMGGKVRETIDFVNLGAVMTCLESKEEVIDFFAHNSKGNYVNRSGSQEISQLEKFRQSITRFFQFLLLGSLASVAQLWLPHESRAQTPTETSTIENAASPALTLEALKQLAMRNGAVSQLSDLQKQERLQDRDIVKSLALPTVLLTTGYLYQSNPNLLTQVANREINQLRQRGAESEFSDLQTNTNFKIDQDVVVLSMGVVQTIYSGGLYDARLHLAESQIKEQETKAQADSLKNLETVEKLYWGILLTERKVDLLDSKYKAAQAKLRAMQASFNERAISKAALAESEIEALQSEQALVEGQQQLLKLRESLNALLGRNLSEPLTLSESPLVRIKKIHEPEDYVRIAENRHPELSYAASRVDSARAYEETLTASAVRSPKAFLLGAVDHTRGVGQGNDLMNWTLGVAVSMPLYDGGRSFAESEKSRLLLGQARLGYTESRRKLYLDIRESVSQLRAASLKLDIAEKGLALALARTTAAKQAIAQNQLPKYQFEATQSAEIESKIALLLAQADYQQWASRLRALTSEDLQ
jgi:anti-anti-sigma factor